MADDKASAEQIAEVKALLLKVVDKPNQIQEKFIGRPPLRWIHDVVKNIQKVTGYPKGLYSGDHEYPADAKTWSKKQKVMWVQRLIDCNLYASQMLGDPVKFKCTPPSILSGKKTAATSVWLKAHATAAANASKLDIPILVRKCNGENVDLTPKGDTDDGAAAEAEAKKKADADAKRAAAKAKAKAEAKAKADKAKADKAKADKAKAEARAKPKPAAAPASSGGGGGGALGSDGLPRLVPSGTPIDIPPTSSSDFVEVSLHMLRAVITPPGSATKHLKRPPFKLLMDLMFAVQDKTGWPKGLFTDDERQAAKGKVEGKIKAQYLKKIIAIVQATNDCNPSLTVRVNPRNIIAGKEVQDTNLLLQEFVKAACSGISASDSLARVQLLRDPAAVAAAKASAAGGGERKESPSIPTLNMQRAHQEKEKSKPPEPEPEPEVPQQSYEPQVVNNTPAPSSQSSAPGLQRLKTARRAPPKVREQHLQKEEKKATSSAPTGLILEDEEVNEDSDSDEEKEETMGGLGGEGQAAGPQGKLVSHILKTAGQDTEKKEGPFAFKRLQSARPNNRSEGLFSKQQIDLLTAQIQSIGQSANPLGKCIDFVYEDIEHMQKELTKWRQDYQKHSTMLEEEKARVATILEPLETELTKHDVSIAEQNKKIFAIKASIHRNQQALEKLMDRKSEVVKEEKSNNYGSGF